MKNALLSSILFAALVSAACASPQQDAGQSHETVSDPNACATCHQNEFVAVTHPLHLGKKPTTCGVCHTQEQWHPTVLNHPWALTGAHAKVDCFECHSGAAPVFRGLGKECVDCHRKDAAKVDFAAHATFGTKCIDCHTTVGWKPATGPHHEPEPEPDAGPPAAPVASTPVPAKTPVSRPKPKPKPTATPSATPTAKPPDVVTRPSKQWKP